MHRYFIELAYKGTGYSGWQLQPNAVTVQEKLNASLSVLCKSVIETTGCGRTDAGVHASQFFAHFDYAPGIQDTASFGYHLNALLPADISIYQIIEVDPDRHSRFDAIQRTYRYFISMVKNPFNTETAWQRWMNPDMQSMNEAAFLLPAYSDFSSFAKSGGQQFTNLCKVSKAQWDADKDMLVFEISADRFLRGMVRAIVGTLLDVGNGKTTLNEFKSVLENKKRSDAGESVPAHGLFLSKVEYPYINSVTRNIFSPTYAGSLR